MTGKYERMASAAAGCAAWLWVTPAGAQEPHHEVAAGGVVFSSAWLPEVGPRGDWSAGLLGCIGGPGFEVAGAVRAGGEGHFCAEEGSLLALGGAQGGFTLHPGPLLASATLTGGGGFLSVAHPTEPTWSTAFLYAKPTASLGMGLGWFGVELGAYATLGLPLVQWVEEDIGWGGPFATTGAQVSPLFGEFWPHEPAPRAARSDRWRPPPPMPPGAAPIATPTEPPPAGPPVSSPGATGPGEAPLAVPVAPQGSATAPVTPQPMPQGAVRAVGPLDDELAEVRAELDGLARSLEAQAAATGADEQVQRAARAAVQAAEAALKAAEAALQETARELGTAPGPPPPPPAE